MKDELFSELLESLREGGAILKGEAAPSRAFVVAKHPEAVWDVVRPKRTA